MSTTYIYRVDLNERGVFNARVIDEHDNTVYALSNEPRECCDDSNDPALWCDGCQNDPCGDEPERCVLADYSGELWQVDAGYMKHTGDVAGLTKYLREMQVIGNDATVMHECDVPARMARL